MMSSNVLPPRGSCIMSLLDELLAKRTLNSLSFHLCGSGACLSCLTYAKNAFRKGRGVPLLATLRG
eukprot:5711110-Amphidinium_carterae.1